LGALLFPRERLKLDKIPDPGKKVEVFQVEFGELAGQNLRLLPGRAEFFNENQAFAKSLASSALDENLIVGEILVADLDAQLGCQAFQMLKKNGV
jgi:hypothetical protein